jgi:hypothetical protein
MPASAAKAAFGHLASPIAWQLPEMLGTLPAPEALPEFAAGPRQALRRAERSHSFFHSGFLWRMRSFFL